MWVSWVVECPSGRRAGRTVRRRPSLPLPSCGMAREGSGKALASTLGRMAGRSDTIQPPETDDGPRRGAGDGHAPAAGRISHRSPSSSGPTRRSSDHRGWAGAGRLRRERPSGGAPTLDGAGAVIAILTGLLINARLLVYSSSLACRGGTADVVPIRRRRNDHRPHVGSGGTARQPVQRPSPATPSFHRRWSHARHRMVSRDGRWSGARHRLDWLDLEVVVPLCLLGSGGSGVASSRLPVP